MNTDTTKVTTEIPTLQPEYDLPPVGSLLSLPTDIQTILNRPALDCKTQLKEQIKALFKYGEFVLDLRVSKYLFF